VKKKLKELLPQLESDSAFEQARQNLIKAADARGKAASFSIHPGKNS